MAHKITEDDAQVAAALKSATGISSGSICITLHENLSLKRTSVRWMPITTSVNFSFSR